MPVLDVLRVLSEFALVVLVPLLIWNARTMMDFRDGLRDVRHELLGVDGTNGLKSRIAELGRRSHEHGTTLTTHSFQLAEVRHQVTELRDGRP